jgi:hypothetical protein
MNLRDELWPNLIDVGESGRNELNIAFPIEVYDNKNKRNKLVHLNIIEIRD